MTIPTTPQGLREIAAKLRNPWEVEVRGSDVECLSPDDLEAIASVIEQARRDGMEEAAKIAIGCTLWLDRDKPVTNLYDKAFNEGVEHVVRAIRSSKETGT